MINGLLWILSGFGFGVGFFIAEFVVWAIADKIYPDPDKSFLPTDKEIDAAFQELTDTENADYVIPKR